MLSEAREEIVKADQKASAILATLGVGFAALAGGLLASNWSPSVLSGLHLWTWWFALIAAALSVLSAASAIWPRYQKVDVSSGITYWGHVATFTSLEDLTAALEADKSDEIYRTRHQLWKISKIVNRKYELIRWSLSLAGLSIILFSLTAWA